jgi:hypothetical protein
MGSRIDGRCSHCTLHVRERVSVVVFQHHDTLDAASCGGAFPVRTSAYMLDVLDGEVHEESEGLYSHESTTQGEHGRGNVMDDTFGFCTEYMSRFIPTRRRVWDDKEEPGLFDEEPEGSGVKRLLSERLRFWAHSFVLDNAAHLAGMRR